MDISDFSEAELQQAFFVYCAKLMLQAKQKGHSMVVMEADPKIVFGLPIDPAKMEAGLLTIAVAAGPSREKVKQAIALVEHEQ